MSSDSAKGESDVVSDCDSDLRVASRTELLSRQKQTSDNGQVTVTESRARGPEQELLPAPQQLGPAWVPSSGCWAGQLSAHLEPGCLNKQPHARVSEQASS